MVADLSLAVADEKVTSTSSGGYTLWGLADHLGTIRDIADANEATGVTSVVNHRRYNGFGKLMSQTGAADIIFGYTGKYSDYLVNSQEKEGHMAGGWWFDLHVFRIAPEVLPLGPENGIVDMETDRHVGHELEILISIAGFKSPRLVSSQTCCGLKKNCCK